MAHVARTICLSIIAFAIPSSALAASEIYFSPAAMVLGTSSPAEIAIEVSSDPKTNAFEAEVRIPEGLELLDAYDANSIVNLWIRRPSYDERTRILEFAGVTPGGFSGKGARLVVLSLKGRSSGPADLLFLPATRLLLSGPDPVRADLSLGRAHIVVDPSKSGTENDIPDIDPPEEFAPFVASSSGSFGNRQSLYFATQDKGSGILGYSVAFSDTETTDYASLSWHSAQSPYLLSDDETRSFIYVRATDRKSNQRVEHVAPPQPGSSSHLSWSILIGIAVIFALGWQSIRKRP